MNYINKHGQIITDIKEIKLNYIQTIKEWIKVIEKEDDNYIDCTFVEIIEEETLDLLRYLRGVEHI
ncbi:MAG: hypothetical protein ACRC6E_03725 [Fusobacteriaceae bacterium]